MDYSIIISNLFIACLIGGLAIVVGCAGKRAAIAHLLWVVFFIKLVTPPIASFPLHVPSYDAFSSFASLWRSFSSLMLSVWVFGFVVLVAKGLIRYVRFARIIQQQGVVDTKATEFVARLIGETKRNLPKVVRLPVRLSPMLFGDLWRPSIVCPDELWGVLNEQQREAFLAHEAAHFYRRDHWVRWLEWIVTAIYWWFPGVYFGRRQLERHEEACCDAWAVRVLGTTPRDYAETLLSVVDYVSEHKARIPRLANGMQPTESLEERLSLLMRPQASPTHSGWKMTSLVFCALLWLAHPVFTEVPGLSFSIWNRDVSNKHAAASMVRGSEGVRYESTALNIVEDRFQWPSDNELPPIPRGFWNKQPERLWVDFRLQISGVQIVAEAGKGITLDNGTRKPVRFTHDELTALVEIPSSGRVIMGDSQGRLRLWDLQDAVPVSLIGQHVAPVTSVAFHPESGLVSSDSQGNIIRWDIDSGSIHARAKWDQPIQSIRFSADGGSLAVHTGVWACNEAPSYVCIVHGTTLEPFEEFKLYQPAAVVLEYSIEAQSLSKPKRSCSWATLEWNGVLRDVQAKRIIGMVDKNIVSALAFVQHSLCMEHVSYQLPSTYEE
ncbi:M56 family metallopeptidase [Pirellulaceae bacterium SH449]